MPFRAGGARRPASLDVLVAAWVLVWVLAGIAVEREVSGLTELSSTVVTVGQAVQSAGTALGGLGEVPVIGGSVGEALAEPSRQIVGAGESAEQSGAESRESIQDLSTLLGLAVVLIPSLPVLVLYLPFRLSRVRESRALASLVRRASDERRFERFLARTGDHVAGRPAQRLAWSVARPVAGGSPGRCANRPRHGMTVTVPSMSEWMVQT